jgi:hypothetical protein
VPLHLDLAAGTVAGQPILGRSAAEVRSALGPPGFVEHYPRRADLGYGPRTAPRLEVILNGTAWALEFEGPDDTEARLGRLLAIAPRALQRRIAAVYPQAFRLTRSYHCDAKGCFGLFASADGTRRIIFGISSGRRYVGLQLSHPPPADR